MHPNSKGVDALTVWVVQYDAFYDGQNKQKYGSDYPLVLMEIIYKGSVPY